jgi:hypothetical protein
MKLSSAVLVSAFLLATVGCGSSETTPPADGSVPPADTGADTSTLADAATAADTGAADTGSADTATSDTAAMTDTAAPGAQGSLSLTIDGMMMTAQVVVGSIDTNPAIGSTVTGVFGASSLIAPHVTIVLPTPTAVGTFDQTMGATRINFDQNKSVWLCDRYKMGSSCSLTLTKVGGPGEEVTGTFTGTLVRESGTLEPATRMITAGSFSFLRQ